MKSKLKLSVFAIAIIVITGAYALFAYVNKNHNGIVTSDNLPLTRIGYKEKVSTPADFEKAATVAVPSVVHIKTVTRFKEVSGKNQEQQNPLDNDDFLKRFFGDNRRFLQQPDQRASGSGVIISNDGYIVTNNHVVDGATEVTVTLNERKTYKAKVIGVDTNTDLAVIKIDAKKLSVIPIGNSDEVNVGQWVLAIGYPLNLDVTVTQGIVSAKSRNIGINQQSVAPVEAFIQTDAAVNPGSSGGALVNTEGELIGINSAIASPTGSYAGYAYAIPSNLMKKVVGDIMRFGAVQRGYLGISMAPEDLDEAKKKELGINDDIAGIWVMETDQAGAGAEAGIKKGDVITKVNGVEVITNSQLSEQIAMLKPGDRISLTIIRGKEEKTVSAVLKNNMGTFASQKAAALKALGAEFSTISKEDAAKMGIAGGVQVTNIADGIIDDQTNMRPGFVITKIGDTPVKSVDELKDALSKQDSNFQIQGMYPGSKEVYYYGINDFKK